MAQDHFFHYGRLLIPIESEDEGEELWLYGYVDYTDEFGQNHRSGYARVYMVGEKNNLFFVDRANWNYDCLRLPDGGDKPKDNESN